jgi:hypothetical protein
MASNKQYKIDLISVSADEMEAPSLVQILKIADLPNMPNPFGNRLKRGKFINNDGKNWLLDNSLSRFNYKRSKYSSKISQFRFNLSFNTPLELNELDADRFMYSIAQHISQSGWRNRRQGVGAYFQLGQVSEGSIRAEIYAGIVAAGAFVANYPDLKQGFQEILTDGQFITEQISTAIRASKLPEIPNDEEQRDAPNMLLHEERQRRQRPSQSRLLPDN